MPDEADMAQHAIDLHLRAALSAVGARAMDDVAGPEMIDGVACCRECGDPIPTERLKAVPGASRCRECQNEWEEAEGM